MWVLRVKLFSGTTSAGQNFLRSVLYINLLKRETVFQTKKTVWWVLSTRLHAYFVNLGRNYFLKNVDVHPQQRSTFTSKQEEKVSELFSFLNIYQNGSVENVCVCVLVRDIRLYIKSKVKCVSSIEIENDINRRRRNRVHIFNESMRDF